MNSLVRAVFFTPVGEPARNLARRDFFWSRIARVIRREFATPIVKSTYPHSGALVNEWLWRARVCVSARTLYACDYLNIRDSLTHSRTHAIAYLLTYSSIHARTHARQL